MEIWNSIAGNTEVSKFADRKQAVGRVWKAIQPLASDGHASEPEAGKRKGARQSAKKAKAAKKERQPKKAPANYRRTVPTRRPT